MIQNYFAKFFQWTAQENIATSDFIFERAKFSYKIEFI